MDDLDRIDPRRFDVLAIVKLLNEYRELSAEEREANLNEWDYSGLTDAQHPLCVLLPELHNQSTIVRDRSGQLLLVWDTPRGDAWDAGPLYRQHLPGDALLLELLLDDDHQLADFDPDLLRRVIDSLPTAPGPVVSY